MNHYSSSSRGGGTPFMQVIAKAARFGNGVGSGGSDCDSRSNQSGNSDTSTAKQVRVARHQRRLSSGAAALRRRTGGGGGCGNASGPTNKPHMLSTASAAAEVPHMNIPHNHGVVSTSFHQNSQSLRDGFGGGNDCYDGGPQWLTLDSLIHLNDFVCGGGGGMGGGGSRHFRSRGGEGADGDVLFASSNHDCRSLSRRSGRQHPFQSCPFDDDDSNSILTDQYEPFADGYNNAFSVSG